jgi:flagellar biosynthesis protein FlhF
MQIKRFEAKTMTEALKRVKDEFGPEAVILSARSLGYGRGLFGTVRTAGVEVTAANDSGGAAHGGAGRGYGFAPAAAAAAPGPAPARLPGLLQSLNHGLKSLTGRRGPAAAEPAAVLASPGLADFYQHLLALDIRRELAADLVEQIKRRAGDDPQADAHRLREALGEILQRLGLLALPGPDGAAASRLTVLIGPPGVGKTNTAVKIAAAHCARNNRRVALMTLDDLRIGAIEQMRIYAGILRLPMAAAASAEEARQAVAGFGQMERIIVDTPGLGRGEEDRMAALQEILAGLGGKEVHLVLSASVREKDLLRTVESWKGFGLDRLAFTRLDETGACGSLVNLPFMTRLPLSFVSTGPRVPEDLAPGSVDALVALLVPPPAGRPAAAAAEGILGGPGHREPAGRFMANRNSDLYHLTDCKWVGKIKTANLIRFATAEEAESQRFQPCRNCCPAQADPADEQAIPRAGGRSLGRH